MDISLRETLGLADSFQMLFLFTLTYALTLHGLSSICIFFTFAFACLLSLSFPSFFVVFVIRINFVLLPLGSATSTYIYGSMRSRIQKRSSSFCPSRTSDFSTTRRTMLHSCSFTPELVASSIEAAFRPSIIDLLSSTGEFKSCSKMKIRSHEMYDAVGTQVPKAKTQATDRNKV